MMALDRLSTLLVDACGVDVDLTLNENTSHILSIEKQMGRAKLSLHKKFLDAPSRVIKALIDFLKTKDRQAKVELQRYMHVAFQTMPKRKPKNLQPYGDVYDLAEIYKRLNQVYFGSSLNLSITWYGRKFTNKRSSVTLGQYVSDSKLVKIHKILDSSDIPPYFIEYVVYHEMLHHVSPPYFDEKGLCRMHGKEFKDKEKAFFHYKEARDWEKNFRKKVLR